MSIVASNSNKHNILDAVMFQALAMTWTTPPVAHKTGLLPFPEEMASSQTPYLCVRGGRFRGWANYPQLQPTTGTAWARLRGGAGRIFTWDFEVITLYDYPQVPGDPTDPGSSAQIVRSAEADQLSLEQWFQQVPNLPDSGGNPTCERTLIYDLDSTRSEKYGIYIAGRPLWMTKLIVQAAERQGVDYGA